jgi:hypothetical protein
MKTPRILGRGNFLGTASHPRGDQASGITLLEMTVVILVLLSLVAILFWGGQAWKNGSDRAICIVNIHSMQKGVRSYANLNNLIPGATVVGLENQIIGAGLFLEVRPQCPGPGSYTMGGDVIPPIGTLYMNCSLAGTRGHVPNDHTGW